MTEKEVLMMKQKKKIVSGSLAAVLLTAALALTACSAGDEAASGTDADREVRLTARLGGRSLTRSDAATPLASGTDVDVYFNGVKVDYTVSGSEGALAPTASGGKVYWPASDQLTICAVSPSYKAGEVFTVAADQTAASPASDLCYSASQVYTNTGSAVSLGFTHQLAKVNVNVSQGTTSFSLPATVRLNVLPGTTLDFPTTETASPASATGSRGVTISCPSGSAIIPPQSLNAGDPLIIVDIGGGEYDFVYAIPTGGMTFEGGMEYTYNLTLSDQYLQYVSVTSTVSPWTANSGLTADQVSAGLPLGRAAGVNIEVGMLLCSNGDFVSPVNGNLPSSCTDAGHKAVAVVAYYDPLGVAVEDGTVFSGLALALADCNSSNCTWSDPDNLSNPRLRWCDQLSEVCLSRQTTDVATARVWYDGLACTQALVNHASHVGTHYAAIAASTYKYATGVAYGAHPSGTSDWFLPSMGQWNLMVKSMCASGADLTTIGNANNNASAFNVKIESAGGTGVLTEAYWFSVEYGTSSAWYIDFNSGNASYYGGKRYTGYVRPVLAF